MRDELTDSIGVLSPQRSFHIWLADIPFSQKDIPPSGIGLVIWQLSPETGSQPDTGVAGDSTVRIRVCQLARLR